ncbi:MAG: hypothetical protein ACLQMF_07795 [Rectinemataceae bacterium]
MDSIIRRAPASASGEPKAIRASSASRSALALASIQGSAVFSAVPEAAGVAGPIDVGAAFGEAALEVTVFAVAALPVEVEAQERDKASPSAAIAAKRA